MKPMIPSRRRHGPALAVLGAALALALALALAACTSEPGAGPLPEPLPGPGGVLGGLVHDAGGAPVEGVVVTAEPLSDGVTATVQKRLDAVRRGDEANDDVADDPAAKAAGARWATTTDRDGWFAFRDLEPGSYALATEARDHLAGAATATLPDRRAAAMAETTLVDIALVPTGTLHGTASLQNATNHQSTVVYCEGTSYVAVTNSSGDYTMRGVPAGDYTVIATHGGWLDDAAHGSIAAAGDSVEVGALFLRRESNMAPVVSITLPPQGGVTTQWVSNFDAAASDPDGSIVLYEWDFEDDGAIDFASADGPAVSMNFPATGARRAKLRVTDDRGAIALAVVNFTVIEDIHVSSADGNDGNPGTAAAPVATITRGLDMAVAASAPLILVAAGTYIENVALRDNVSVIGGFSPLDWTRNNGDRSLLMSVTPAVRQDGVTGATYTGLHFSSVTATSPGAPSVGLWLASCVDLRFVDCAFTAGGGAAGSSGTAGTAGAAGTSGNTGAAGSSNSSSGGFGGTGGVNFGAGAQGGQGGYLGPGNTGTTASGGALGGSSGSYAGSCGVLAGNGGAGGNGGIGGPRGGDAGNGGSGGQGGQGGGGGGGQGGPGGPSICIFESGTSAPVFQGSPLMMTGTGGAGGAGGLHATGGSSGSTGPNGMSQAIYHP